MDRALKGNASINLWIFYFYEDNFDNSLALNYGWKLAGKREDE